MKIDKISGSRVEFEVTIPSKLFEEALDKAFEKKNKEVEVPGFRKGHLPRSMYEQKFGVESLYEEALNYAIGETYYEVIRKENIKVCAQPSIDLDPAKIERGKDFNYTVKVSVFPEVTLGEYKGLVIETEKAKVSKAEIDEEIEEALKNNSLMVAKDGALEEGDQAIFDFEGFVDGKPFEGGKAENHELVIGSHQFIPGFEEQMVGMMPGEEKDINVKFPENYHAPLASKDAVFHIKLHEVKVEEKPELNDEFVKELEIENVSTVEEYKKHVKEHILFHKKEHINAEAKEELYEKIVSNSKLELAKELIEDEVNYYRQNTESQVKQYGLTLDKYLEIVGKTKESFEDDLKHQAEKSLSFKFVVEKIAEVEGFEATKEEIDQKYVDLATQYKVSDEQARAGIPEYAVKDEILAKKALDFIEKNNTIQEKKVERKAKEE